MNETTNQGVSRRQLIKMGVTAGAAACLTGGLESLSLSPSGAVALSPDAALNELMEGNKRYKSNNLTSFQHDLDILKHILRKSRSHSRPYTLAPIHYLSSCCYDQSIGHVFVTRVAGNIITPEIIGSLEYGAAVLGTESGSRSGHGSCR